MAKQDLIRTKLQRKLFTPYGKSVTLISNSYPVYNSRGEKESGTQTSSTIAIVPYDIIDSRQSYQPFGNLKEGETAAAVPYTVTVNIDDTIVIEDVAWLVKEIQPNYLPDNVVTIVRLAKQQS